MIGSANGLRMTDLVCQFARSIAESRREREDKPADHVKMIGLDPLGRRFGNETQRCRKSKLNGGKNHSGQACWGQQSGARLLLRVQLRTRHRPPHPGRAGSAPRAIGKADCDPPPPDPPVDVRDSPVPLGRPALAADRGEHHGVADLKRRHIMKGPASQALVAGMVAAQ